MKKLLLAVALLVAPVQAQSLEEARQQLAFRHSEQALRTLKRVHSGSRLEWMLLRDQAEAALGETDSKWLERAFPWIGKSSANLLRWRLRRARSLTNWGRLDEAEKAWLELERQGPEPELACDYFLARAEWFRARREDLGEAQNLAEARACARGDFQRALVARAFFFYDLNQSDWAAAEDELGRYTEASGPIGALDALRMEAQLANRQGRNRLARSLYLHLADLEHTAGEFHQEAQSLFWSLDIQKVQEKSDRSVTFGSERLQQRLWQLTRRLPAGSQRLSQLLSLSRVCGSAPALVEARQLYAQLPWSSQRPWVLEMGWRLLEDGQTQAALELCQLALKREPVWSKVLGLQAEIYKRQGKSEAALDCYVRGMKGSSELANGLLALLRQQNRAQDLLRVAQEVCANQKNPRLRASFLRTGLQGSPQADSVADQKFREWCWRELAAQLELLDENDQLEAVLALTYRPPTGVPLAGVLERGLELTQRYQKLQEREQNWERYGRISLSRSSLLEAAGRNAEAQECLLEAEDKLSGARLEAVREALMWLQSKLGQKKESEAMALKVLETLSNPTRRAEIWLHVALCREGRPEALAAYEEAMRVAVEETTRQRILVFHAVALQKLKRYAEAIEMLRALEDGKLPSWARRVRAQTLAECYEQQGQLDSAEATLRKLMADGVKESQQDRVFHLMSLVEFLQRQHRVGASELLESGYREFHEQVTGWPLTRLVRAYAELLKEQGKPVDEVLGQLSGAAPVVESVADFRQTLARIRGLRRDLDSHPFFQAGQLERVQGRLGPRQALLTVCQAGDRLFVLGVDRERTFVHESGVEGGLLQQKTSELGNSAEAREYLSRRMLEPVLPWLGDRDVLWVPLAEGWYVPWESLGKLALERSVTRVGSGDLLRLAAGEWRPFQLVDGVALGAPAEAGLDGARRELEALVQRFPACRLALGAQARVESLSPLPSLIHIASHSRIVGQDPDASYVQLHASRLSLRDIYKLALPAHSLVVLSSCSSALGENRPGGEPLSLAGAFAVAGSQAQISALWPVDDEATAAFFGVFYEHLVAGESPGRCMLAARRRLAEQGHSARDWAAFVLQGCPD